MPAPPRAPPCPALDGGREEGTKEKVGRGGRRYNEGRERGRWERGGKKEEGREKKGRREEAKLNALQSLCPCLEGSWKETA